MEKHIHRNTNHFHRIAPSTIWEARELLVHIMKRDLLVTYKQTVLGVAWVAIQPILMAYSIIFVFDYMGHFPDYGVPYILIALSALICWDFFSGAVTKGCTCLVDDRDLIIRANFPRVILLINAALKNSPGPFINLLVFAGFMMYLDMPFLVTFLLLPLVFLSIALLNLALSLWLGTLNVFKRDVGALVPYLLRLALFVSPVAFTLNSVPEQWQLIYSLNPLVAIIETMRFCLLGEQFRPELFCLLAGGFSLLFILLSGLYIFAINERKFADII
ncbi:MAG: hypothetical protein GJ680_11385 [Alteromonadaceae bacterium]|nr:hypothetical protein [Alteromonadaceae bacterium]